MGSLRDPNPSSKWYVSPREYHYRRYHGICHGFGNITSIHTLQKICQYTIHLFRRCINTKSPTTLENTEVVAQNGQSIETGNAGHTRQRIKTKQKHKKTQHNVRWTLLSANKHR